MSLINRKYTIGDLMNIDSGRQQKASSCKVKLDNVYHEVRKETLLDRFKKNLTNKATTYYLIFKFSVISDTGNVHTVIIRTNPDFKIRNWKRNKVQVYCNCEDFKYRSAFLLNKKDSLFLNDKIEVTLSNFINTAPKRKSTTLLCKHSYAALNWLVSNYDMLMKKL